MKSFVIALVAAGAVSLVGINERPAMAGGWGIHVAGPGYHFDVGHGHGRHRSYYRGAGFHGGHGGWGHGWSGGHSWHDTSHFDYHPGGYVPHYDHVDYVPGHWDYHQQGHWDHHHW